MRIQSLELHNFRLFEQEVFNFPAPFTVLIGENGRGKSAVLHGLRVAASAWLLGFRETEKLHIEQEDVRRVDLDMRFAPQFPVVVRATGEVEGQPVEWSGRKKDFKGGMGRTAWVEAKSLVTLAQQYEDATNVQLTEISLPVLLYLSTARLWVGAKKAVELKTKGSKIQDGYAQALTPEHKRRGTPGRAIALGWIKKAYFQVLADNAKFFGSSAPPPSSAYSYYKDLLDAVWQAIEICVPEWTNLRWGLEDDDLTGLYHRPDSTPEWVPLYYLSDGLRTMAGTVAEIAYRCVTLNGHLGAEAVRASKGLVLIDELDMHLHPNWQRHVVADLKKAFPNLQFVVTTHSPFIVQSLEASELINLDFEDPVMPSAPKDMPIDDVAVDVMGVDDRLGIAGEADQQQAEKHASLLLQAAKTVAKGQLDQVTTQQLEALEETVSDLGLRMALRMERIRKQYPATNSAQ